MSDRAKIWYNTLVVSVKDASFGMPVFFGHMKEEMPLTLREEALKLDELQHENSKLLQTRMKVSQTIMDSIVNLAKNRTKACSTSYGSQGKYSPLDKSKNAIAINRTL